MTLTEEVTGWNGLSEKLNTYAADGSVDEDSPKGWSEMGKQRQQSLEKAAKTKPESNKSRLLAVPHVRNWYEVIERGSKTQQMPGFKD